jgi:hypothetical protein
VIWFQWAVLKESPIDVLPPFPNGVPGANSPAATLRRRSATTTQANGFSVVGRSDFLNVHDTELPLPHVQQVADVEELLLAMQAKLSQCLDRVRPRKLLNSFLRIRKEYPRSPLQPNTHTEIRRANHRAYVAQNQLAESIV